MSQLVVNNQDFSFTSIFSYLSDKVVSAFSWIKTAISDWANRYFSCMGEDVLPPASRSLTGRVSVQETVTPPPATVTTTAPVTAPIEDQPFRNEQMDQAISENCSILFPLLASTRNPFSERVSNVLEKHLKYANTEFSRNRYKFRLNEISNELQALITSQKSNFADMMPLQRTEDTQNKFTSDIETLKRNQQAIAHFVASLN